MNEFLQAALKYESLGFSVIPIKPRDKTPPMVKWTEFQTRRATTEEIKTWWSKTPNANVGIVTGKLSNLFVIDLDKYKPDYKQETVNQYIPENIETVIDKSPRGGSHLYFQYPIDCEPTIHSDTLPGVDYRGEGGYVLAPPSIFEKQQATWIIPPNGKPLAAPPPSFISLLKKASNKINTNYIYTEETTNGENSRHLSSLSSNVFIVGRRDQDLFHLANLLVKGGTERDFLWEVMNIAAKSCNPPFPENELKAKIESAIQRAERKERNLTAEITEWVLSSSGLFLSSEVSKCLHLSSREDQKHLSTVLKRLSNGNAKIIERAGNKNGSFKLIDNNEEVIDWEHADTTPLNIKFPLGVHEKVRVHKGNLIVIAGESNAGKTAYCLNMAALNINDLPINYMSSEMKDGSELKIRLDEFDVGYDVWRKIKFTFRVDDFPEKIIPEAINVIDYLDEGSEAEAYKMSIRLRHIADKLTTGIAIVAIQKDPNKTFGFGGAGTLNRSRVYLTIRKNGTMKIEKAKIWRDKNDNPNGKVMSFKLAAGCKFKAEGEWTRED